MKIFTITILLLFTTMAGFAQTVEFNGQFRERSEYDNKNFHEIVRPDVFHLLRARLGATATVNDQVQVVLEAQNSYTYGDNSRSSLFDLYQGYVEITGLANDHIDVRLGRQVMAYANERLLGKSDWGNFGRSFDGGLLRMHFDDIQVDALGSAIRRRKSADTYLRDVFLTGLWGAWIPTKGTHNINVFWLFDNPVTDYDRQFRHTAGTVFGGTVGNFGYEIEGSYQFGDYFAGNNARQDISAYMIGARVSYHIPGALGLRIGGGIDHLSGYNPDESETYSAFSTLYGTGHKFYGFMDYFTDIPLHTNAYGLFDIIGQISIEPAKNITFALDVHLLKTAVEPVNIPQIKVTKDLGTEVDLTVKWTMAKAVGLTAGFSAFNADLFKAIYQVYNSSKSTTTWGYIMTTVNF